MVRISNLDIIEHLQINSRKSYSSIAKELGVTEAAVRKRVKKMKKEGVIRKFTVDVDPTKLGFKIQAHIGIDTTPEAYTTTMKELADLEEVLSLSASSGDHMIMMECWFRSHDELYKFEDKLRKREGITDICPAIIVEKIK